jgi:hypothetical protein
MGCLSVCDSRMSVYAVPEHRSSQYCLPSVIKSDDVPTSVPCVQMSVSHSIAIALTSIPRETVGTSMQEILNTADLRNERSVIRVHFLVSVYKARSIFVKRSRCGSHRSPLIAQATLRLHSTRLKICCIPFSRLSNDSHNRNTLPLLVAEKCLCLIHRFLGSPLLHQPTQSAWTSSATPRIMIKSLYRQHGLL